MNVKEFYDAVGGDYQKALQIMMNDAFIERMLAKFFANNAYRDIITGYENKDYQAIFSASHSLKGVAGNLSLTPLFEISSKITEATRSLKEVNLDREIEELKRIYNLTEKAYQIRIN